MNTELDNKENLKSQSQLEFNKIRFEELEKIKYEAYTKVFEIMESIDFRSTDSFYYSSIKDSILECRYNINKYNLIYPSNQHFQSELDFIMEKIKDKIIPEKFYDKLIYYKTNNINGYDLYECEKNIMDWFSFIDLSETYINSKTY
jgi:hypothetical protein